MYNSQYHYLFQSISSILHWHDDLDDNDLHLYIKGSLELMTRAGLVSQVFHVLNYATLLEDEKCNDLDEWIGGCFESNILISPCFKDKAILKRRAMLCIQK
jgi:hypothetical protein